MKPLTIIEKSDLKDLEGIIEKNMRGWLEVSRALRRIRDGELYRASDKTFEDYISRRFGKSRQWGYNLIQSGEARDSLMPSLSTTVYNERQARALSKVPPESRDAVVIAASSNGELTAPSIARAAKQLRTESKDDMGFTVPEYAMESWNRREEAQEYLTAISRLKSQLKGVSESKDKLFVEVNFHSVFAHLDQVVADLKRAKPYAVCTGCQGKLPERCQTCNGRGVISKFLYDCTDQKSKDVREMNIKKL